MELGHILFSDHLCPSSFALYLILKLNNRILSAFSTSFFSDRFFFSFLTFISAALFQCCYRHGKNSNHYCLNNCLHFPAPFLLVIMMIPFTPSGTHPDLICPGIIIVTVVRQPLFFLNYLLVNLRHHPASVPAIPYTLCRHKDRLMDG